MNIIFSYIFLGLSLAAPIGPINAAQIDKGIKGGFLNAWLVGLGATMADIVYMLLVYLGLVHFLEIPFMKAFLWLFGFFVLVYTGIESLISAGKLTLHGNRSNVTYSRSFISGFFMSLANPLTILFWLGIYGSVLANAVEAYSMKQLMINSFAIILGLLIWDFTMACVASTFRRFLTNRLLIGISYLSGLSLIGFGIYFGYQAFKLLF
ncbi:LysE family transporter [Metabacillus niabensis]|uniref:Threonine/homoserine/homoserine lactone efflux protein n=1 Tax=Metabacillus niabensis TaxID=324854 RepID=A0ABT9Z912_9BACI|nr:LysE family transporter [Metabacillus niabensis]MDQ0228093.1 threonine/homoserine/homoserine lactone efflux protein [Metabacillus niabensis]